MQFHCAFTAQISERFAGADMLHGKCCKCAIKIHLSYDDYMRLAGIAVLCEKCCKRAIKLHLFCADYMRL